MLYVIERYNRPEKKSQSDQSKYDKYLEQNGHHFTSKLAKYASEQMENRRGSKEHHWTEEEVKSVLSTMGYSKPPTATWGDIVYACNMAYADYYGGSLKTESDAIVQGYEDVTDPDGYPGKIFNRWLSDIIGKEEEVDWEKFL